MTILMKHSRWKIVEDPSLNCPVGVAWFTRGLDLNADIDDATTMHSFFLRLTELVKYLYVKLYKV